MLYANSKDVGLNGRSGRAFVIFVMTETTVQERTLGQGIGRSNAKTVT